MRSQSPLLWLFAASISLFTVACSAAAPAGGQATGGASSATGGRAETGGGGSGGAESARGAGAGGNGGGGGGGQTMTGGSAGLAGAGGVGVGSGGGSGAGGGTGAAAGGSSGVNDAGRDALDATAEVGNPAATDTWANFAQAFMVKYCISCHNDDRAGDATRDYNMLSVIIREKVDIACGTAKSQAERTKRNCPTNAPRANQFPPGSGPKPTDDERDRLLRWIDAGTP
jgi:hypothetical protein